MVGFWRVCVKMGVLVMWHDGLYEGGLCRVVGGLQELWGYVGYVEGWQIV